MKEGNILKNIRKTNWKDEVKRQVVIDHKHVDTKYSPTNEDYDLFIKIATQTQNELFKSMYNYLVKRYGKKSVKTNKEKTFIYAKGDMPVCMVAHLDTVHKIQVGKKDVVIDKDGLISSPYGIGGDDRCGVYAIVKTLKSGRLPSVILTKDEEIGGVGAGDFSDDINLCSDLALSTKFIVEFDRANSGDMVFYNDDNQDFKDFVAQYDFYENFGSFSDISFIAPCSGISAVNLSSGYYNAHSNDEFVSLLILNRNIDRFFRMLDDSMLDDTPTYYYTEKPKTRRKYNYSYGYNTGNTDLSDSDYKDIDDFYDYWLNKSDTYTSGAEVTEYIECENCHELILVDDAKNYYGYNVCATCKKALQEYDF